MTFRSRFLLNSIPVRRGLFGTIFRNKQALSFFRKLAPAVSAGCFRPSTGFGLPARFTWLPFSFCDFSALSVH